jgi:hypothetical protein
MQWNKISPMIWIQEYSRDDDEDERVRQNRGCVTEGIYGRRPSRIRTQNLKAPGTTAPVIRLAELASGNAPP